MQLIELSTLSKMWIGGLLSVAIPETCLICARVVEWQGGCCADCWRSLRFITSPYCPIMGSPFETDHGDDFVSGEALENPPPFERLRASVVYNEASRKLISRLKYSDRTDIVPWIANWMRVAGKELLAAGNYVVPVPLHRGRYIARRYNQSAELARMICRSGEYDYRPEFLRRVKRTRQQVGLSERDREANVAGAFIVPAEMKPYIMGQSIILVDDVYTTGATARAATRALMRAGARQVNVLVFAKVDNRWALE